MNGVKFTFEFSWSANSVSTLDSDVITQPRKRPAEPEDLANKYQRVGEGVESARVAAENQKAVLDLLGRARDSAELFGNMGLAAGEVWRLNYITHRTDVELMCL